MKNQPKILAIITTSPESYNHHCQVNNIPIGASKRVSILSDVKDMVFCGVLEIDGHSNVTDRVKRETYERIEPQKVNLGNEETN